MTWRWSALRLRTKGLIVVGLPVLPLAMYWLVVVLAVARQEQPSNTESRNLVVQAGLARAFSDLLDADAGARDHLLTDSKRSYRRYEAAMARLPADLAALDAAVIDPELRVSLEGLKAVVEDETAVLARMVGAPPPGFPAMTELATIDRSIANLDQVRTLSQAMEKRQTTLAAAQSLQDYRSRQLFFVAFLVGSMLCVAGGVMAALVLASGVSRRAQALARNADRLAHGLPSEPLPVGEDEIGMVDARLREAGRLLQRRESELRERTTQLEDANRELEAFSYSVSHDLRAPLRAIAGFSEALEQDYGGRLDEDGRDLLRRVEAAAERMGSLIDDLLNLSRLTRVELRREQVDLAESARDILADLARRTGREADVVMPLRLMADADPDLVHIALANLIDNAWKYTGKTSEPRIEIGSTTNGGGLVYHVRDNGAGFDMAYVDKLFGAFQRLHADRDFEGSGIGLAIVQRIVHRHGGRIWAEGAVNRGATFHFTLEPGPSAPGA